MYFKTTHKSKNEFIVIFTYQKNRMETNIVLAIVGARTFNDIRSFNKHILEWIAENGKPDKIVSGGAVGADRLARNFARENKIQLVEFLPDYNKYGRRAPLMRNTQIVEVCTHAIAFPSREGSGTQDTIRKLESAKKPVTIHYVM